MQRAFSPELKAKTLHMTEQIEQAMQEDLEQLSWMSSDTRRQALEKLHGITNKIGYPDRWRDYSSVRVRRDDFFGNVVRASLFESHRQLAKIGKLCASSSLYLSKPWGYLDQPDFINAVIKIETTLAPLELLHALQTIELAQGRIRTIKNGPRTIDLDLILYEGVVMNSEELTLPHPRMQEREFVMGPLKEI